MSDSISPNNIRPKCINAVSMDYQLWPLKIKRNNFIRIQAETYILLNIVYRVFISGIYSSILRCNKNPGALTTKWIGGFECYIQRKIPDKLLSVISTFLCDLCQAFI